MEKGVLSSVPVGSGNFGGGTPFGGDTSVVELVENPAPGLTDPIKNEEFIEETPKLDAPVRKVESQPAQEESEGQLLLKIFKRDGVVGDDFVVDPKATIAEVATKYEEYVTARTEEIIEDRIKELYGEETMNAAKMLNAGMTTESKHEYARLSKYSEVDVESDDEIQIANTRHIIEEYYRATLKGKSLEKNLEAIDETSDDFIEIGRESKEYWAEKRDAMKNDWLAKSKARDEQKTAFNTQVQSLIESGEVMGMKLEKSEINRYMQDIFKKTETYNKTNEYGEVTVEKGSKYEKAWEELKKDPQKVAVLMMLVSDGLSLKLPIQAGKNLAGQELEQALAGRLRSEGQGQARQLTKAFPLSLKDSFKAELVGQGTF